MIGLVSIIDDTVIVLNASAQLYIVYAFSLSPIYLIVVALRDVFSRAGTRFCNAS